jgi:hypothetical protein
MRYTCDKAVQDFQAFILYLTGTGTAIANPVPNIPMPQIILNQPFVCALVSSQPISASMTLYEWMHCNSQTSQIPTLLQSQLSYNSISKICATSIA